MKRDVYGGSEEDKRIPAQHDKKVIAVIIFTFFKLLICDTVTP